VPIGSLMVEQQPAQEGSKSDEFLRLITEHFERTGHTDISMRAMGEVAGTDARMLCYYFGTRERLLAAVLKNLRDQQVVDHLRAATSRRDFMRRAWSHHAEPELGPQIRLFFHLAGQAVHESSSNPSVLQSIEAWSSRFIELGVQEGLRRRAAEDEARLVCAAVRGLILDREITGDRAGAERSFTLMLDTLLPRGA
jgi:AcrR family transcriptional regulator